MSFYVVKCNAKQSIGEIVFYDMAYQILLMNEMCHYDDIGTKNTHQQNGCVLGDKM